MDSSTYTDSKHFQMRMDDAHVAEVLRSNGQRMFKYSDVTVINVSKMSKVNRDNILENAKSLNFTIIQSDKMKKKKKTKTKTKTGCKEID